MRKASMLAAVSAFAIAASGQGFAQVQEEPDGVRKLDRVTVTAVKREQDLNDVPVRGRGERTTAGSRELTWR
jgi:hypothetical protein